MPDSESESSGKENEEVVQNIFDTAKNSVSIEDHDIKSSDLKKNLPLHSILKCGVSVDEKILKGIIEENPACVSERNVSNDLPLVIALKHSCTESVISIILEEYPEAASEFSGDDRTPLFIALENCAPDGVIISLLGYAPHHVKIEDINIGKTPIQIATEEEYSPFVVHSLLKEDLPIDLKKKKRGKYIDHMHSWHHITCKCADLYHMIVTKLLLDCTQPQVLAMANMKGPDGSTILDRATPVCKYEIRVMLRFFYTLELVSQEPAFANPLSGTQIFYALQFKLPSNVDSIDIVHDGKNDKLEEYYETWDDASRFSDGTKSTKSTKNTWSSRSQQSVGDRLKYIESEKGRLVIAKLTPKADIVDREIRVRNDFGLSKHYVPPIISVYHTSRHAAYSAAMTEPGYCITMQGADNTAENYLTSRQRAGKTFPAKALKRIAHSLLHIHEKGLVHGDFGAHNIGKFGRRWKLLGVGGSVPIGDMIDPTRGFYHPPEAIDTITTRSRPLGKKNVTCTIVPIMANPKHGELF